MQSNFLETVLACPACKRTLEVSQNLARCGHCQISYPKIDNIWSLISLDNKKLAKSASGYEELHMKPAGRISDGSYEILASFARSNRTLDIACGQGFIEELAPDTVGLDFSKTALIKATKNGAKNLVWGAAENLPFIDNSFDLAICAGSLEQFANPQKAISEMGRVSKIQVLTVHREFNFPFASQMRKLITKILGVKSQPIEEPLKWDQLKKMLEKAGLHIVFHGYWTLPLNFGRVFAPLPVFKKIPACFFVITIKKIK